MINDVSCLPEKGEGQSDSTKFAIDPSVASLRHLPISTLPETSSFLRNSHHNFYCQPEFLDIAIVKKNRHFRSFMFIQEFHNIPEFPFQTVMIIKISVGLISVLF